MTDIVCMIIIMIILGQLFIQEVLLAAFAEVGGYNALVAKYSSALPANFTSLDPQRYNISPQCYTPRADAFSLLRDTSTGDLPWPGVLFGIAILGGWYWCSDQVRKVGFMIGWRFYLLTMTQTGETGEYLGESSHQCS